MGDAKLVEKRVMITEGNPSGEILGKAISSFMRNTDVMRIQIDRDQLLTGDDGEAYKVCIIRYSVVERLPKWKAS